MQNLVVALIISTWVSGAFAALEGPQTFTIDGRLFQSTALNAPALLDSGVIKVQVLSPDASCILYEEAQVFNTTASDGYFNLAVGSINGSPKRTASDSGNGMATVFSNTIISGINGKQSSDGTTNCTYNPASSASRLVRIKVTPTSDGLTRTLSPDLTMNSVPGAMVAERAETLQGIAASSFLQLGTGSTSQSNIDNVFSATNYPRLTDLLSVGTGSYVRESSNGAALAPTVAGDAAAPSAGQFWYDTASNQLKFYNGTVIKSVGSTSASDLSSGTIGGAVGINTSGNIATTGNISASGNGTTTGVITGQTVSANSVNANLLRMADQQGTPRYIEFKAPASIGASNLTYTWPAAFPGANMVLQSDSAGTLSWVAAGGGGAGDLLANGTIPLSADWDINGATAGGTRKITGLDVASVSDGAVSKAQLDSAVSTAGGSYVTRDGLSGLTGDWDANGVTAGGTRLITGLADPSVGDGAATKAYVDSSITTVGGRILGSALAAPGAGQVGQAIRWNAGNTAWEYFTPGTGNGDALVSGKLSQFAATSSSELAGVLSDESGSGVVVYGTSPTLTTPALRGFSLNGSTSGGVNFSVAATGAAGSYVWPSAAPGSNMVLQSNNTGVLSWVSAASGTGDLLANGTVAMSADWDLNGATAGGTRKITGLDAPTVDDGAANKAYADANLRGNALATPVGQAGNSIRWNAGNTAWEYFTPSTGDLLANGTVALSADWDLNGATAGGSRRITGLMSPTVNDGAANKGYVDGTFVKLDGTSTITADWDINGATAGGTRKLTGVADPTVGDGVVNKTYADGRLLGSALAAPGAGQVGQSIRWNAGNTAWEYYTPSSGAGDALTSGKLSQFAATSSAELFGVINDETGSAAGALAVFSKSPVIETPSLKGFSLNGATSGGVNFSVAATGATGSYVWPSAAPASNMVLQSNASGSLSWVTAATGTVTGVTSANSDIGVAGTAAAPILTLNSGVAADQIVKLNASAQLPAVSGVNLTSINASNLTSGTIPDARLSSKVLQGPSVPSAGNIGQSVRLNATGTAWEYYTPSAGVGTGDLKADGTVAMTADWDVDGAGAGTRKFTGFAAPTAADGLSTKGYSDARLLGNTLAAPAAGQVGQSIRWNAGNTAWEYYTPLTSIAADSLNFTDLSDSLALDATTSITSPTGQAYVLSINNEGTGDSFRVNDAASDTTPFVVDASGQVGVGTSSPAFKLAVDGGTGSKVLEAKSGTVGSASHFQMNMNNSDAVVDAFSLDLDTTSNGAFYLSTEDGTYRSAMVYADTSDNADTTFGISTSSNSGTLYSPAFVVKQGGDVGIGDSTPDAKLDVAGTLGLSGSTSGTLTFAAPATVTSGTYIWPAATPASNMVLQSSNTGALSWVAQSAGSPGGANTQIQFNNSGSFAGDADFVWNNTAKQLGLGLSPSADYRLDVVGNASTSHVARFTGGTWDDAVVGIRSATGAGMPSLLFSQPATQDYQFFVSSGGNRDFYLNPGSNFNSPSVDSLIFSDTGQLGLGTNASPTLGARLDVAGTTAANSTIIIPRATTGTRPVTGVNGMMRYNTTTSKFEAYQNNTWVDMIGGGGLSGLTAGRVSFATSATSIGDSADFTFNDTTNVLAVTGDITYSGVLTDTSDRRLKKDIKPMSGAEIAEKLSKINTYTFRMKDQPADSPVEYGVMAQEVEEIFPELVKTANDKMQSKSVNYIGFIAPMIETIRQLKAENDSLKKQVGQIQALQENAKREIASVARDEELEKLRNEQRLFMFIIAAGLIIFALRGRFKRRA